MFQSSFRLPLLTCCALAIIICSAAVAFTEEPGFVIIRGKATCLDKSGRPVDELFECSGGRFGLVDKAAKLFTFIERDSLAPVFNDRRVRERELQITARLDANNRIELIKVQSIREGRLHDLYYYCDVCSIKMYTPGDCPCCQKKMEFVETASE